MLVGGRVDPTFQRPFLALSHHSFTVIFDPGIPGLMMPGLGGQTVHACHSLDAVYEHPDGRRYRQLSPRLFPFADFVDHVI